MDGEGWTPEGKRIMKELDELSGLLVKIGYQHGKVSEDDGADVCDVATWNEFGTVNMPSRPFMRGSVDNNEKKIIAFLQKQVQDIILRGKTAEQAFKEIGLFQKDLMQKTITNGDFVPNAASTVRRKKSSKPLIDTGTMRQSVLYVIKEKG